MRNLVFTIAYDGTDFQGWQTQPGFRTVQETLEKAIAEFTGEPRIRLDASGRTDAGVHAKGQVANFYTAAKYPADVFLNAVNARLPHDVAIHEAREAPPSFDANKDAVRKLYRYVIHDAAMADPFLRKYCYHYKKRLDDAAMARSAECLRGRHDFRSFETDWPNRLSSVRTITHIAVERHDDQIWLDVAADGFLYNMVRSIAGTLIDVGRSHIPESAVKEILEAGDRKLAGPTSPPQGLFLMRVTYE